MTLGTRRIGSGGQNKKPSALKIIEGTQNVSRVNKNEPQLKVKLPVPPTWLRKSARIHYNRVGKILCSMRVMTAADGEALALLADAYCDYLEIAKAVEEDGQIYKIFDAQGNEIIRANPAVARKSALWTQLKSLMINFGLTPASRIAVNALPNNETKDKKKWR